MPTLSCNRYGMLFASHRMRDARLTVPPSRARTEAGCDNRGDHSPAAQDRHAGAGGRVHNVVVASHTMHTPPQSFTQAHTLISRSHAGSPRTASRRQEAPGGHRGEHALHAFACADVSRFIHTRTSHTPCRRLSRLPRGARTFTDPKSFQSCL